jgi:hypothetical protein
MRRRADMNERRLALYEKSKFTMDALVPEGFIGPFEGWSDGTDWNGWAVPFFELDQAMEVLAALRRTGRTSEYDPQTDTFVFAEQEDDDEEQYPSSEIDTADGPRKVYGLGAGVWIWDFDEDPD